MLAKKATIGLSQKLPILRYLHVRLSENILNANISCCEADIAQVKSWRGLSARRIYELF
jgi:hypothetical protein